MYDMYIVHVKRESFTFIKVCYKANSISPLSSELYHIISFYHCPVYDRDTAPNLGHYIYISKYFYPAVNIPNLSVTELSTGVDRRVDDPSPFEKRGGQEYLLTPPPFLETNLKVYTVL